MFLLQQSTHRMLIRHDPDVGHRFVPNLRARIPNENGGYYVVTNSSGFRSDFEFQAPKIERPRILMFGDSYTAGDNVSNCDRYSDRLAALSHAEVYNYGVSGTGTDQHLLIARKFASGVEADLAVICVYIDSFHRIQVSHRPAVDRASGKRVLVPKPYFQLRNGQLELQQVPVPVEREEDSASDTPAKSKRDDVWLKRLHGIYSTLPALKQLRESDLLAEPVSRAITEFRRVRGQHPYPDILSDDTPGWLLMRAILETFIAELRPLPVVIFPIPTRDFYEIGMKPVYQPLFESLDDPANHVHVGDVSSELISLPYKNRVRLAHQVGGHFTPYANELVAGSMHRFITERGLLPASANNGHSADRLTSSSIASRPAREFSAGTPSTVKTNGTATGATSAARLPSPPVGSYILGISAFYHNSAAALICDGKIVAAAEEERFTRVKNDRRLPLNAINFCLEEAGIHQSDLAAVAFYDDSALTFERIIHSLMAVDRDSAEKMWNTIVPEWACNKLHFPSIIREQLHYQGKVLQGMHHRSHAASCFYPSPFESAAILTVDGVGEWATATIGRGRDSEIEILKEMRFPHSLGLLYSAFTHFTGFKINSGEYKMMGLAPYGRPIYADKILQNIVDVKADGSIEMNMDYFSFLKDVSTTSKKFDELFGGPRRDPESRITRREIDIASSIQAVAEQVILKMAAHAREITGEQKLCLAGGVALNCVANGRLLRERLFDDLWIQPAAGDSGCALGVALDVWHTYFGSKRDKVCAHSSQGGSYLGPSFSEDEIESFLQTNGYPYEKLSDDERAKRLSNEIAAGKVVGHFADRLEFGPRSLGARSIIGDARNTEMQVTLNLQIKYRESFRPFAPAVLRERVSDYFELDRDSPYMLIVAPVKEERHLPFDLNQLSQEDDLLPVVRQPRSDLPAITHVDYSARIQTVRPEHHPVFYELIKQFERDTGCGVVVNTSFNVRGEPIVCTPFDAYRCFMRTEMDVLALGNFILIKSGQPQWPEGRGEGLENEDITKVKHVHVDETVRQKLSVIFDRDFWPVAQRLQLAGGVLIGRTASQPSSNWTAVTKPSNWQAAFEFPTAWQAGHPGPSQLANAVLSRWPAANAAQELTTVMTKLMEVGLAHRMVAEVTDELPESVYVMF